jgi:NADH-quinone oxidoreductase subunit L
VGIGGAGLTAFYVFRLIFLVFHGEARDAALAEHAHEAPRVMAVPLIILGALSIAGGWIGVPRALSLGGDWNRIGRWLAPALAPAEGVLRAGGHAAARHSAAGEIGAMGLSLILAGAGIGLAWGFYRGHPEWLERFTARFDPLVRLARAKYYVDEAYGRLFVQPYHTLCRVARETDARGVDGLVNGVWRTADVVGHFGRYVQTGFVRNYALYLLIGAILILYWVLP